jgi:hypothetical protein
MNNFSIDLASIEEKELTHSLTEEQLEELRSEYNRLKAKAENGQDLTLEEQRTIIRWMRADRETKFILNHKPAKEKKIKEPKEPKVPKEKKRKKLTKREFNIILLKELQGETLTEEEIIDRDRYLENVTIKAV